MGGKCLKMNENAQQINRMNCRLYGWGQYQKDPPPNQCKNHKTLEFIELGQIDSDICQGDYDDQGWEIFDSNICAGVVNGQGQGLLPCQHWLGATHQPARTFYTQQDTSIWNKIA